MERVLILSLFALGCTEYEVGEYRDAYDGEFRAISGRVCDYDRNTWLEGAIVYAHLYTPDNHVLYDTAMSTTDETGAFKLEKLPGEGVYTVYVAYGSAIVDQCDVQVKTEDVVLDDPNCGAGEASVAVVTGDYDEFEVIAAGLGYGSYDLINGKTGEELAQFLQSQANLEVYDVVFFNGGHIEEDVFYDTDGNAAAQVAAVQESLRQYVSNGGVVWATDWSYDVVESCWRDKVEFLGEDRTPDAAQKGDAQTVSATVMDDSLRASLGKDTVSVLFDLIVWPVVESVDASVTVYLQSDVVWREGQETYEQPSSPVLVAFDVGSGKVVFSSFRNAANTQGAIWETVRFVANSF